MHECSLLNAAYEDYLKCSKSGSVDLCFTDQNKTYAYSIAYRQSLAYFCQLNCYFCGHKSGEHHNGAVFSFRLYCYCVWSANSLDVPLPSTTLVIDYFSNTVNCYFWFHACRVSWAVDE